MSAEVGAAVPSAGDCDGDAAWQRHVLHIHDGGTSVVVDLGAESGPRIVHWGEELAGSTETTLAALAAASLTQTVTAGLDRPGQLGLVSTPAYGWLGTPAIEGHRDGKMFSLRLELESVDASVNSATLRLTDAEADMEATVELQVDAGGLFGQRLTLTNCGAKRYSLQSAMLSFPVAWEGTELLDCSGHHLYERAPQRHEFTVGCYVRESRRGRPGADAPILLAAGRPGFGFERGRVQAIHVAWSGGYRLCAERSSGGEALLAGGELLLPGEIMLAQGDHYQTPWVFGSWGDGLSELSHRFHAYLRARTRHPRTPRPVTLNTWEAVYFDQSLPGLKRLAEVAASVGVQRFVLDDGWFEGRHDDTRGLGDWRVDRTTWPQGLHPLCDHVTGLGMEFGLWVEPEMVNPDSSLAREHPDWIMRARTELPPSGRHQQVLNLAVPAASDYIAGCLEDLLAEYPISYLKWDHNRDLVDPGDGPGGRSVVHDHVQALYRLIERLRARHPELEIEDCASGGARVDLGILARTDRIWTSDTLDPYDRLQIQRYTQLLVPPEMMGMHISGPVVHATGRSAPLDLSAAVALLGHLGIEWNIADLDRSTIDRLAEWIELYKRIQARLSNAITVDVDGCEPGVDVRGLVAVDHDYAVFTVIQVATPLAVPAGRLRLPTLTPSALYKLSLLRESSHAGPPRWAAQQLVMTGRELDVVGLRMGLLRPGEVTVIELERCDQ